jgi:antitoxin (DNA-binding transcriptional repressor) of toxin-antitoxin stability system
MDSCLTAYVNHFSFTFVSDNTASIRELRTDFRSVKRKMEEHGEIVITDHGEPAFVLKPLPQAGRRHVPPRDYYSRLLRRQPKRISDADTRSFWEGERGES